MKHTPAPWVIYRPENSNGYCYINSAEEPMSVGTVCTTYLHDTERGKADTNLIAAAPEMLLALEKALEREYNAFEPDNQSKSYKELEAIINKARGADHD